MIIDILTNAESIQQYMMKRASQKYKPWFAPVWLPLSISREQRAAYVVASALYGNTAERNQKWREAVKIINTLFEGD